ncbi:MAG: copper resistance protein NlpE [Bacteroidales bacterium]|nr:copper resistance protein NlpE [Bacteroidales bacterium]
MKKNLFLLLLMVAVVACSGGTKKQQVAEEEGIESVDIVDDGHYAENSLDYWGVYKGTLPAADGPGIETTLVINDDDTFNLTSVYVDRNTTIEEKGTYTLEKGYMTLSFDGDQEAQYYFIGENRATRLNADKEFIAGELADQYVLNKVE